MLLYLVLALNFFMVGGVYAAEGQQGTAPAAAAVPTPGIVGEVNGIIRSLVPVLRRLAEVRGLPVREFLEAESLNVVINFFLDPALAEDPFVRCIKEIRQDPSMGPLITSARHKYFADYQRLVAYFLKSTFANPAPQLLLHATFCRFLLHVLGHPEGCGSVLDQSTLFNRRHSGQRHLWDLYLKSLISGADASLNFLSVGDRFLPLLRREGVAFARRIEKFVFEQQANFEHSFFTGQGRGPMRIFLLLAEKNPESRVFKDLFCPLLPRLISSLTLSLFKDLIGEVFAHPSPSQGLVRAALESLQEEYPVEVYAVLPGCSPAIVDDFFSEFTTADFAGGVGDIPEYARMLGKLSSLVEMGAFRGRLDDVEAQFKAFAEGVIAAERGLLEKGEGSGKWAHVWYRLAQCLAHLAVEQDKEKKKGGLWDMCEALVLLYLDGCAADESWAQILALHYKRDPKKCLEILISCIPSTGSSSLRVCRFFSLMQEIDRYFFEGLDESSINIYSGGLFDKCTPEVLAKWISIFQLWERLGDYADVSMGGFKNVFWGLNLFVLWFEKLVALDLVGVRAENGAVFVLSQMKALGKGFVIYLNSTAKIVGEDTFQKYADLGGGNYFKMLKECERRFNQAVAHLIIKHEVNKVAPYAGQALELASSFLPNNEKIEGFWHRTTDAGVSTSADVAMAGAGGPSGSAGDQGSVADTSADDCCQEKPLKRSKASSKDRA